MIISIMSEDCTNCVHPVLIETTIIRAVNTHKFLGPCKFFVSPSQKVADTEARSTLFIADNHLTGVALEGSPKEGRGPSCLFAFDG